MEETAARLRKTFQYKNADPDSDDSLPEALDEEEQETLIQTLKTQNALRNKQYTTAFLALPLLSALIYLPALFRPETALLSLLSITSLGASAYVLWFLPLPWESSGLERKLRSSARGGAGMGALEGVEKGPLELYLPYLNAVLVAVLALAGFIGRRADENEGELWFALLPGVVYGVMVVAKVIMGSVDVGELEGLKYDYKGA